MDNTSRMVALLSAVRKQMNGAVLDSLRYYGADYGANYGVAIHTLRDMARDVGEDNAFARYLYLQQVRELRIVALWIADPAQVTPADFGFWAAGIVNSEVAEQAAQALLARTDCVEEFLDAWSRSSDELLVYTALLAAARSRRVGLSGRVRSAIERSVSAFPDNRLAAAGVTALAVALARRDADAKRTIRELVSSLPDSPTAHSVREEVLWQTEY